MPDPAACQTEVVDLMVGTQEAVIEVDRAAAKLTVTYENPAHAGSG